MKTLFLLLHDEDLETAVIAMKLITRVYHLNPAYAKPGRLFFQCDAD